MPKFLAKFLVILTILILLIAGAVFAIFRSSFFRIATVEVLGSPRIEEIKNVFIAELNKNSFLRFWGPENLLFWSKNAIKEKPSSLFWISDFNLKRDWRLKKVFIEVKERQPSLIGCSGLPPRCYWLSAEGIVLAEAPSAEGFLVPQIFIESEQSLIIGDLFLASADLLRNTLEIIRNLSDFTFIPSRFVVKNLDFQELEVETNGPKLYFSLRLNPQNVIRILNDLAVNVNFSKLNYLDLRTENRIFYK